MQGQAAEDQPTACTLETWAPLAAAFPRANHSSLAAGVTAGLLCRLPAVRLGARWGCAATRWAGLAAARGRGAAPAATAAFGSSHPGWQGEAHVEPGVRVMLAAASAALPHCRRRLLPLHRSLGAASIKCAATVLVLWTAAAPCKPPCAELGVAVCRVCTGCGRRLCHRLYDSSTQFRAV